MSRRGPWHDGPRPWVVAEVGVNHEGDAALARRLVDAAAEAGADAVKFQTFDPELLVSPAASTAPYQADRTAVTTQRQLLAGYTFDRDTWHELAARARNHGLVVASTAFDRPSLALVEELDPGFHKVPSGEVTNLGLLRAVAACGRPVLVSTGMADEAEVAAALDALDAAPEVVLLHCVTAYPVEPEHLNLASIPYLRERFGREVGFSDHSIGSVGGIAAVVLGAVVVERHLTLDRSLPGPDHEASLTPAEFAEYVLRLRAAAAALGTPGIRRLDVEAPNVAAARRSWHATRTLAAGTRLRADDVVALRPERGISTGVDVIGRTLARSVVEGEPLVAEDLEAP